MTEGVPREPGATFPPREHIAAAQQLPTVVLPRRAVPLRGATEERPPKDRARRLVEWHSLQIDRLEGGQAERAEIARDREHEVARLLRGPLRNEPDTDKRQIATKVDVVLISHAHPHRTHGAREPVAPAKDSEIDTTHAIARQP